MYFLISGLKGLIFTRRFFRGGAQWNSENQSYYTGWKADTTRPSPGRWRWTSALSLWSKERGLPNLGLLRSDSDYEIFCQNACIAKTTVEAWWKVLISFRLDSCNLLVPKSSNRKVRFWNCVKHVSYAETFICLCSVTQPCLFVWSISCILVSACERGNSTRDERVQVGDNVTLSDCKDLGKQSIPDSSKVTASLSSEGSTHILIKGDVATNKTSAYKCHPEDMKNLGIDHCLLEIVAYRSSDGHWAFHANITFGSKSGEGLPSWLTLTYAYHDGVNIEQLYTEFNIYYGETISTSWPFQSFLRGDGKPSS